MTFRSCLNFLEKSFYICEAGFGLFESISASFLSYFLEIARYSLQNAKENTLEIPLK